MITKENTVDNLKALIRYRMERANETKGIEAKSHNGVQGMLGLHFIKTKILDVDLGRHYTELLNARITGDYDDFERFDPDDINCFYEDSLRFILAAAELLDFNDIAEEMRKKIREIDV